MRVTGKSQPDNALAETKGRSRMTQCWKSKLFRLHQEESGQDLIEYALVAAMLGLGAAAAMHSLAGSISNFLVGVGNILTNAV
jgi:pilus assembly protein Flp/PilA